ncbi:hypothetical protein QL285_014279 [Trifolium repens]|nr:hypothetical protein QL285_014279 [Trifolium repens]
MLTTVVEDAIVHIISLISSIIGCRVSFPKLSISSKWTPSPILRCFATLFNDSGDISMGEEVSMLVLLGDLEGSLGVDGIPLLFPTVSTMFFSFLDSKITPVSFISLLRKCGRR